MMKSVLVIPNLRKRGIGEAVEHVCAVLRRHQAEILLPRHTSVLSNGEDIRFVALDDGVREADFIIALGGDGTILRIAALAARTNTPLLGINLGHLGFICSLEANEIELIGRVFEGNYTMDSRMMLKAEVVRGGETVYTAIALNEVVITKHNPFKIVKIEVEADRKQVVRFRGDGLIIATPTGSTAYSGSAGGPYIEPSAENIAITPICPFSIAARSFVFAPNRTLCIRAGTADGGVTTVSADGEQGFDLRPEDEVYIQKADTAVQMIHVKEYSFFHVLHEKLSDGGID